MLRPDAAVRAARLALPAAVLFLSASLPAPAAAGAWSPDRLINCQKCNVEEPKIAVNANGNAIAVWTQNNNEVFTITASRYSAATGQWSGNWGKFDRIYTGARNAKKPEVGMDRQGNALLVWTEAGSPNIYSSRYRAAEQRWTSPIVIHSGDVDIRSVRLAVDGAGNGVAIWNENNDGESGPMRAVRYDASVDRWEATQPLEGQRNVSFRSNVAAGPDGRFFAVWTQLSGEDWTIAGASYDAARRSWSAPIAIARRKPAGGLLEFPNVSMDRSGNIHVAWFEQNPSEEGNFGNILVRRYDAASGQWAAPVRFMEGAVQEVSMATDPQGNVFLSWTNLADGYYKTVVSRYDARSRLWSWPCPVSGNQQTARSHVAADRFGNAVVVWEGRTDAGKQPSGTPYKPHAAHYHIGEGRWRQAVPIQRDPVEGILPQVGLDGRGRAIAVWMHDSGARWMDNTIWNMHFGRMTP